jgi:HAD superfamily hydrolase (TIGR01509 family)
LPLRHRRCWIFDLDGTLTRAVHDFDAIRRELELPAGRPILEALAELPPDEARPRWQRLDAIELELARSARPAAGARELLEALAARGRLLGVLTRNSLANAVETLRGAGLERFFAAECVLGRESAAPKPDPEGIRRLLAGWSAQPEQAVMVGDHRFDLLTGRAAGVLTVHVDSSERFVWPEQADLCFGDLDALRRALPDAGPDLE